MLTEEYVFRLKGPPCHSWIVTFASFILIGFIPISLLIPQHELYQFITSAVALCAFMVGIARGVI